MRVQRGVLCSLLVACAVLAQDDAVHQTAKAYLDALTGEGDDAARESLLGGVTMNASIASIGSWRIVAEDPVRKETGDLRTAVQLMTDLDRAGRSTLASLLKESGGVGGDDVQVRELSQDEASRLLAPTRERANRFFKTLPVLAYVARVNHEVYWHPKNPIRPLIAKAGAGTYTLEVHRMTIESLEGPRKEVRRWPLRVLRFQTTGGLDTGWKILPASDWNGD